MKRFLKEIRFLIEYFLVLIPYHGIRMLPRAAMRGFSRLTARLLYWMVPSARRIVAANIQAAFPEKSALEVEQLTKSSLFNMVYNMVDFIWLMGKPERIDRYTSLPEPVFKLLRDSVETGKRIIFVNPHLGSWEGSGIIATHTAQIKLAAIAKITRNPYLNNLLNKDNRERGGIKIIFSKGAMKETLKCLKLGMSIGTLIDQNTRVRDGGVFVDFFGLPVASSRAPATIWNYCRTNHIPAIIIYGTSVRINDILVAHGEVLKKDYDEYTDDTEIIQELMNISEKFIRKFPDQYLWFYRRFQHIPPDAPPEIRSRFPFYATVPEEKFFQKRTRDVIENE